MNDRELDRLIARANPYGDQTVADLPTGGAEADLLEEIVSNVTPTLTPVDDPGGPVRRGRRRLVLVAVAAATALIVLGGVFLPRGSGPVAPPSAYAAELVAVAEANPRLLLNEPGWRIDYVSELTVANGEMRFKNGTRELAVHWRPADSYQSYLRDRGADGNTSQPIQLLGKTGTMFKYRGWDDFTTLLPPTGPNFLEIRGTVGPEQAYRALIGKLDPVDVNTWLDAMPDSVVKPDDRASVIAGMLADVPRPPGFDPGRLASGITTQRYHVGAEVTGAVTCAWITEWKNAKQAGDAERVRKAVAALASSHRWRILHEMNAEGDYPEVLWEVADSVVKTGKPMDGYQGAIGCR